MFPGLRGNTLRATILVLLGCGGVVSSTVPFVQDPGDDWEGERGVSIGALWQGSWQAGRCFEGPCQRIRSTG
jgi:hypothetical protein